MKEGVERNSGKFLPGTQLLRLHPPLLFPLGLRSHSDTSLPAPSSGGTSPPTSAVERKTSTACLRLLLARRSHEQDGPMSKAAPSARRSHQQDGPTSKKVLDLKPGLHRPAFLPHLYPQDLLLGLPPGAHLGEVYPMSASGTATTSTERWADSSSSGGTARCGSGLSSAGGTARRASWSYPQPCHPASCASPWRPGLPPTASPPPPISSPGSPA